MSHASKCLTSPRWLIALLVAVCGVHGARAQAAPAQAPADAPARAVKVVCCRVSLQFLVDGQPVSNASLMDFDTRDRNVVVDKPAPGWNFRFSLKPSDDRQTLRWTGRIDTAGRVVQSWAVTGAMKDAQTFSAMDPSTHRKLSVFARAMVLIAPVPRPGEAKPARVPGNGTQAEP